MRTRATGSARLAVRIRGPQAACRSPLLHGFSCTGESGCRWRPPCRDGAASFPTCRDTAGYDAPPRRGLAHAIAPPMRWLSRARPRWESGGSRWSAIPMGGRLALALALRHPVRVARVALIGVSAGIADKTNATGAPRRTAALAMPSRASGIAAFVAPVGGASPLRPQQKLAPDLRRPCVPTACGTTPARPRAALRPFGTGAQPDSA